MAEKKNQLLKITLVISAIVTLGYGVIYLFFPEAQIKMAGGEPILPGWIRWFGGLMIPIGIGCIMMVRNPVKQGIFVTTLCMGSFLVGMASFYEILFQWDSSYNLLSSLIPAIVLTIVSILLLISLMKSKEILW